MLGASDLHIKSGARPRLRINGRILDLEGSRVLSGSEVRELLVEVLSKNQRELFESAEEQDLSYGTEEMGRFRCNFFCDSNGPAGSFRRIPPEVPSLYELDLPPVAETLADLHSGLVLVTGATGSGKSTTLAAIIDLINERHSRSIVTLEDPVEYMHDSKSSIVHQRGLHTDIVDFASGIRAALRQNPDILLVGEMRDLETMRLALSAVETGFLVFATLHTNSAASSIDRIIDVFPVDEQPQARSILASSLAAVMCQVLLPRIDREGQVPATEVLIATPAISNLIREGKMKDVPTQIQTGKQHGMHTLDDSLEKLFKEHKIDGPTAFAHCTNQARFEKLGIC